MILGVKLTFLCILLFLNLGLLVFFPVSDVVCISLIINLLYVFQEFCFHRMHPERSVLGPLLFDTLIKIFSAPLNIQVVKICRY